MIRAIRPNAMAQDDASLITGWNLSPNVAYTVQFNPGSSACGVLLYSEDMTAIIASGAALVGTAQPCVLVQQSETVGMVDADLGWHLLLTTDGTEQPRTIRIGPAVDLPDEIHPIYADDDLAVVRATAGVDDHAYYIDDISVTCPLGFGAWIGGIVSVPVDGAVVVGQVENITWTGTPNGASEQSVIRRHVAIAPAPHVDPVPITPPAVTDDTAETDAETEATGNVLANDDAGLVIVAVNGLTANVGESVAGSDGGLFVVNADGSWTFDPAGDFASLAGEDTAETSVSYHVSNGEAEASATLTITVSSGAASLWTPAEITTAQWLNFADSAALTLDGSAISQAADQSGNSRHATMTGTSRPTLSGGMAVFDGVNDYMSISVPQASPSHVFAVIDTTALGTGWRVFLDRASGSSPYPPALYLGTNTQTRTPSIYWGTSVALSDSVARQQLMILEFRIGPLVVGVRANGGSEKTGTTGQSVLSTWTSLNTQNTYGQQSAFSLGEEMIVSSALSDADRQRVEGYLAHKWDAILGVTTLVDALPSGHPYKSAAPTVWEPAMPITPQSLLPRRQIPEVATGPVVAVGVGSVSVQIRPDLAVLVTTSTPYAVGQMVSVAIPGGNLSSAQIIGGAAGSAPRIRHVMV